MAFIAAKSLDKNISLKSVFSIKNCRNEISVIKDVINGEWTLSPDRILYRKLGVKGKYKGREVNCEYQLPYRQISARVLFWVERPHIDIREIPSSQQKLLVETGYFTTDEKARLIVNMFPLSNFFNTENIKYLLENLLSVFESIENKNIDNALDVWKNLPERCFFRKSPIYFN